MFLHIGSEKSFSHIVFILFYQIPAENVLSLFVGKSIVFKPQNFESENM